MKRSGKFYRKNEAEVMRMLGLDPTPNSGSGWIVKEDGQSDDVIAQLKSTDAQSIRVAFKDINMLECNAVIAHKLPVFVLQFLATGDIFLLVRPELLQELSQYLKTGRADNTRLLPLDVTEGHTERSEGQKRKAIKSSNTARSEIKKEMESKYNKKWRKAT